MADFDLELTDTFGGEANYSWVRRGIVTVASGKRRTIVCAAKAWAGWTGTPCEVEDYSDSLTIRPRGICQVLFVTWRNA